MNRVIIALALVVAPVAAFAQRVPQPLPRPVPLPATDSLGVPPLVMVVIAGEGPAQAALIGALEGAVYAATLAERRPDCAPIASPGQAAAEGAVFGGLRGLLFRRQARVPSVLVNERVPKAGPRPDPNRRAPLTPLGGGGCMALAANSPAGERR